MGKSSTPAARKELAEAIVAIGFSKTEESLNENLPVFNALVRRVRKIRMMGAAALALAYVASGRFDAYIESGISLWDIAAGGLILECAGGEFWHRPLPAASTIPHDRQQRPAARQAGSGRPRRTQELGGSRLKQEPSQLTPRYRTS